MTGDQWGRVAIVRHGIARQYLETVYRPPWPDWVSGYRKYSEGDMPVFEAMTLLDPRLWPDPLQGHEALAKAQFGEPLRDAPPLARCQAEVLWGYECSLGARLVLDHLFPRGRGGPSRSDNLLVLCEEHNRCKADDVHLYPWEAGEPGWLEGVLKTIAFTAPNS